jgi:DNA-binding transcriptional LysR family regulator
MSLFDGLLPFYYVAEMRSFRRAAERLSVSPAAVSKAVSKLEEELGVRLLHRTTRRVALSDEGELFFARVKEAVTQVRAGRELVAGAQRAPRGELVVSAPFVLGRYLAARLPAFCRRYPTVRVLLRFSDRLSRLVDERVDVALRVGDVGAPTLVARSLMAPRWCTAASPAYLARRHRPEHPGELARHDCLRFRSTRGKPVDWQFLDAPSGTPRTWPVQGPVEVDQGELLVELAAQGVGIVQAFDFMLADDLAAGRLVEVLGEYAVSGPTIHAVFLPEKRRNPKVRAFVDYLLEG